MTQLGDILSELEYRRSFLRNVKYGELEPRLTGFYQWLISQQAVRAIMEDLESSGETAKTWDLSILNLGSLACTAEQIAGVGIRLMKFIAEGGDTWELAERVGIYLDGRQPERSIDNLMNSYITPAIDYVHRKLSFGVSKEQNQIDLTDRMRPRPWYPLEITESLQAFFRDHPDSRQNAFVMMRFGETKAHTSIITAIRRTLSKYGIKGLRADDKQYHDDLFPNVLTYIHGCDLGIAVFERLEEEYFNPNVSFEVGYFRALRKPVCLLKDKTLKTLHTDLVGKLYKSFDPQNPEETVPPELEKWLRDKDIITI